MKLYHVVAMANNRVIGKDNKLPWHFSSDMKHFKGLTTGSTVIMGRKTYESIGNPLPNRENFVISRTKSGDAGHLRFFGSIEDALKSVMTPKAFIIGGANLYEQTLFLVGGIYLTRIEADYEGDAFYPEIPKGFVEKNRIKLQDGPEIWVIEYERRGLVHGPQTTVHERK